jgi:hypothetical protein
MQKASPEEANTYTNRNTEYQKYWLTKIIELYRNSATKLIFAQTPHMPLRALTPIQSAPDLRDILPKQGNVFFVDEKIFDDLNTDAYMYDALHLNDAGKSLFTHRLGNEIVKIIDKRLRP